MAFLFNADGLTEIENDFRKSEKEGSPGLQEKIRSLEILRALNQGIVSGTESGPGLYRLSGIFPIDALNTNYVRAASLAFSQVGYKNEHALVLHIEYELVDCYWVLGLRYQTSTFYFADLRDEIGCSLAFARAFPPRHIGTSPRFDLISQPIATYRGFRLRTLIESLSKNLVNEQVTDFDHFISPDEWDGFMGFMKRVQGAIQEVSKEMNNEASA